MASMSGNRHLTTCAEAAFKGPASHLWRRGGVAKFLSASCYENQSQVLRSMRNLGFKHLFFMFIKVGHQ